MELEGDKNGRKENGVGEREKMEEEQTGMSEELGALEVVVFVAVACSGKVSFQG